GRLARAGTHADAWASSTGWAVPRAILRNRDRHPSPAGGERRAAGRSRWRWVRHRATIAGRPETGQVCVRTRPTRTGYVLVDNVGVMSGGLESHAIRGVSELAPGRLQ